MGCHPPHKAPPSRPRRHRDEHHAPRLPMIQSNRRQASCCCVQLNSKHQNVL
jgi:hypothetical protein